VSLGALFLGREHPELLGLIEHRHEPTIPLNNLPEKPLDYGSIL